AGLKARVAEQLRCRAAAAGRVDRPGEGGRSGGAGGVLGGHRDGGGAGRGRGAGDQPGRGADGQPGRRAGGGVGGGAAGGGGGGGGGRGGGVPRRAAAGERRRAVRRAQAGRAVVADFAGAQVSRGAGAVGAGGDVEQVRRVAVRIGRGVGTGRWRAGQGVDRGDDRGGGAGPADLKPAALTECVEDRDAGGRV